MKIFIAIEEYFVTEVGHWLDLTVSRLRYVGYLSIVRRP